MRQDFFTYEPQFLLVAAGNHKPSFKGVDEAIRRRVQLVPFLQNIPAEERDKDLPEKLKAEWPAILRRLIDGCLAWQREGLNPPESVRKASDEYLSAEDTLGQWLEERCVVRPAIAFTAAAALYGDWRGWCERGGSSPGNQRTFGKALDERGFARARRNTAKGFAGIGLREPPREPESPGDRSDRSSVVDRQRIPAPSTSYTPTSDKGGPVTSVTRHGKPAADGVPDPRQLDLEAAIGEVRTSVPAGFPVQWRLIADAGEASRALAALPVADDETPSGQEP